MKEVFKLIYSAFKKIRSKDSFVQNLAFLTGSKAIILLIGFLITPILTRIYSPTAYGFFAEFNAWYAIVVIILTMRYPIAFVLPKDDSVFFGLVKLSLLLTVLGSLLITLGIILNHFFGWYEIVDLKGYDYLLIVALALGSLTIIFQHWNIRLKKFRQTSNWSVANSLASKGFTLILGVITNGYVGGIIISELFRHVLSTISQGAIVGWKKIKETVESTASIKEAAIQYKKYPLIVLPVGWVNQIINQLPVIALSPVFGVSTIGHLALSNSVLAMPLQLIGENTLGPVLLQKSTEFTSPEDMTDRYEKLFLVLITLAIPPFCIFFYFGENIFQFVFGEEWGLAGEISSIMCISYAFRLINTPSSSIIRLKRLEQYTILNSVGFGIATLLAIIISIREDDFIIGIWILSIGQAMVFIFSTFFYAKLINVNLWRLILVLIASIAISVSFIMFLMIIWD